jgi:hypothetical protein
VVIEATPRSSMTRRESWDPASGAGKGTPEDKLPTENRGGRPLLQITPRKIASWDNSKP